MKQKTLKKVEAVEEAGKAGKADMVAKAEENKESPYNWLPSIKEGEQIIGGAKLRDGLIVPPKEEES